MSILAFFTLSTLSLVLFYHFGGNLFQDIPNHRSMHTAPTKKSAGFWFSSVFLLALVYSFYTEQIQLHSFVIFFSGISFFTILGLVDDIYHLSSKRKLYLEVPFLLVLLYFFPLPFQMFGWDFGNHWIINSIISTVYILFVLNICNFMDGLDSYLTGSFFIFILNLLIFEVSLSEDFLYLLFLYSLCILPFLYFNLPNAKLFMGDAGSLPIGFTIAIAPFFIKGDLSGDISVAPLLIPVFWIDGFYTIIIRLFQKKNILEAHREHLYQRIQLSFLGKRSTLLLFLFQNSLPILFFLCFQKGFIQSYFMLYLLIFLFSHILYFSINYSVARKKQIQ